MLISFAVTVKLICVFVFAYTKSRFSHDEAHIFSSHFIAVREILEVNCDIESLPIPVTPFFMLTGPYLGLEPQFYTAIFNKNGVYRAIHILSYFCSKPKVGLGFGSLGPYVGIFCSKPHSNVWLTIGLACGIFRQST